ncbi:MAG: radical SAM protein, partial [Acidobacteria bacterium]|nr:radical SAM protein [Acidobacteriota bacterium]
MNPSDVLSPQRLIEDERQLVNISPHGRIRIAVGYPNTYRVALSSLAHQWVTRLATRNADVGVERFYLDGSPKGRTFEHHSPLGDMDILAFTCSFELDAVHVLTILDNAGIPRHSADRNARHPLIVVGGPVASINPLPMSPSVDVFCLGAGEILLPKLLEILKDTPDRTRLLEDLANRDG